MRISRRILCSAATTLAATAAMLAQVPGLQERIDRAHPGDTILVAAGQYDGDLVLNKRLCIAGTGFPVLRGSGKGSVLTIQADSCEFRGFVVERSGPMLVHEDAGILLRSSRNRIIDNRLRDVLFGIYLWNAHENLIEGNIVVGRESLSQGERGSGIHIWNSNRNILLKNEISFARDGFYIQNASRTIVRDNRVTDLRYGLHYMYADSNEFTGNAFVRNVAGAAVMYSRGIRMRRNLFLHNRGFASYGILFQDCHDMLADSNVVADNVVGMFFEASTNNRIQHNIVAQNDLAIQMFQNSTGNVFTENNFIDNLNPLSIVGKRTGSMWSFNERGNYWSSYDGYDLDADGKGDIPMKVVNVFDYIEQHASSARVLLYSPAAQALSAASKAFPIIQLNHERDEFPLMRPVPLRGLAMAAAESDDLRRDEASHGTFWALLFQGIGIGGIGWAVGRLRKKETS